MSLESTGAAYLAAPGLLEHLLAELQARERVLEEREGLVLTAGPARHAAWAANVWRNPRIIQADSIKQAVRELKALQRNWALHPTGHFRRAALVQEQLPPVKARPLVFGEPAPSSPLGSWTLLERDLLLASPDCSSPFPHGQVRFEEDKIGPPNRAYLKLWELFTLTGQQPAPGEVCLDLGGSPGGWSWVLAGLGARVFFVDRALPEPRVARLQKVDVCQGSAFALQPDVAGPVDWLFWDVACYPERLRVFLERWIEACPELRIMATVKFQGGPDQSAFESLAALPGASLRHLCHNKHELTLIRLP